MHPRTFTATAPLLLVSLALGCAHAQGPDSAAAEDRDAVVRLRHENAELRREVQLLEDRLRQAEAGDETYAAHGGRELPVVRLQSPPPGRAPTPTPGTVSGVPQRYRDPVTLSPVPHSSPDLTGVAAATSPSLGPAPAAAPITQLAPEPSPATKPVEAAPAPEETANESGRRYRLVGSRLVELTQNKPPPPKPKEKPRTRRGRAKAKQQAANVVAEYTAAMNVYRSGQYREAEMAFTHIAASYPAHDYADNALYWKGEAAYDQRHYADALAAFTAVVEQYGGGNKAPDALLKIGLCYGRLGDRDNARDVLNKLVAAYPAAGATQIARDKLPEFED